MILQQRNSCLKFRRRTSYSVGVIKLFYNHFCISHDDLVKGPQEATLDSHLLLMASNMGAQKARSMKSGSGAFDIDDFVSKLVMFMGGQKSLEDALPDDSDLEDINDISSTLDWDRIGRKALAKSRRVPAMGFMYLSHLFILVTVLISLVG
jgi:hypothetical protein